MTYSWSSATHRGYVRPINEDTLIVDSELGLYAVLDGMGGENAGEVASRLAADTIRDFVWRRSGELAPRELLERAIEEGAVAVFAASKERSEYQRMGTTVVACLVVDSTRVIIGHAGDSRAYLLRGSQLQALTHDHSLVQEAIDSGTLTAEQAESFPYRNAITRNLGARNGARPDIREQTLEPGDRLLLCSDGLHNSAWTEAIQHVLELGGAPDHVASQLIELALSGGGKDNISVVVLELPRV